MEGKVMGKASKVQDENSAAPSHQIQKKKSALPVPVRKVAQSQRRILGPLSQAQTNDLNHNGLSTAREPSANKSASHSRLNSKLASNSASTKPTGLSNVLSTDVDGNVPQRMLKVSTTFPNWPTPSSVSLKLAKSQTGLLSVVEEQQQLGIRFQEDSSALRSILTNTGISRSTLGTISELLKPQRLTEGQGRPVYTPHKVRSSMYSQEPRMSITDSCKQYQKFLRQERGLEAKSDCASPVLPRAHPKAAAVSESPLVKGMKSKRVPGSMYPKYSLRSLLGERQGVGEKRDPATPADGGGRAGTPRTPLLAYSRVAQTPSTVTPARRVPVQSGNNTGGRTETDPWSQPKDSTRKKLRWADVLSSCSPDLSRTARQTKPATPSSSTSTTTSTGEGSALAGSGGTSSFGQDPLPRGPRAVRPAPAPPGQASHGRSPPRNSLNTADAAGEDDGDGDSSALTHNKAWSHSTRSYHSGSTLCSQGEERLGAASSFSAHPASPRQHHHHHHHHNHSHSHHQQQRVCRGDGGDSGVAGVGEGRGEVAARGARVVPLSSAFSASHSGAAAYCEPSASAQEFLARLQVLEEQERCIQHEMQLLRMAMQREQEGDSNGNHVSDASATSEQASSSKSGSVDRHHLPPNPGPSSRDILLQQRPSLEHHHTPQPRPSTLGCLQMAPPTDQPFQPNRPGQLFPATTSSSSSFFSCPPVGLCNNAFCNTASSAVDSDSSSSPDINSNILAAGFGKTAEVSDRCLGGLAATEAVTLAAFGTGDAPPTGVPGDNMAAPGGNGSPRSAGLKAGRDDGDGGEVRPTEDNAQTGPQGDDLSALPGGLAARSADSQSAVGGDSKRRAERGSPSARLDTDKPSQSGACVEDLEFSDVETEAERPGHSLWLPVDSGRWSDREGPDLSARLPGRKVLQADASLRQSVDMDVEESDDEDDVAGSSTTAVFSPFVPQAPRQAGPAGRDQPPSCIYDEVTAKVNPVSVIIRPSVVVSSSAGCEANGLAANFLVNPPIWTALALQSAANNNYNSSSSSSSSSSTSLALSGPESRPSGTGRPLARHSPSVCEIEAVAAAVSRSITLSPKLVRRGSPPKRASRLGTGRRSNSPALSPSCSSSAAKRCPLRATLRQGPGQIPAAALKNPDVFLEALLEDECALYAGRLQSFFKNLETSCDRLELPDPVARVLDEGDDMHFVPISEESSYLRPVLPDSAFVCYIPV